jgi:hypothetical protein
MSLMDAVEPSTMSPLGLLDWWIWVVRPAVRRGSIQARFALVT